VAEATAAAREDALAEAIAAAVAASRLRRVPLRAVLAAAASVDRSGAAAPGWRTRVAAAIAMLEAQGLVEVPVTRFDRSAEPALPSYVTRPAPGRDGDDDNPVVWHAALSWAAVEADAGTLTAAERRLLVAVNRWLGHRRGLVVPLRERSLELFGDEKTLEDWVGGRLFGPGRLSFELFECEPCWPPVHETVFGPGDWLIVENYTTYVSLSRWAARWADAGHFHGRVVWGSGNQVGTRLAALAGAGHDRAHPGPPGGGPDGVSEAARAVLHYFGDVDAGGFRVARSAVRRAEDLGLGVVVPARGLYHLALTHGTRRPVPGGSGSATTAEWAQRWLGPPLGADAAAIVAAGERIVQETVGLEMLAGVTVDDAF
jgi:hypothetical protein